MILECSCGKMYKVKDEASATPQKCRVCGGELKPAGGGGSGREAELEAKVKELEKRLEEQGRAAASGGGDAENLQQQLWDLRTETDEKIRDYERRLSEAEEKASREAAERKRLESSTKGAETTQARALVEKQKTIEALDASIADYRSKLDTLQKKLDKAEMQRLADRDTFENREREREKKDREAQDKARESQDQTVAELRKEHQKAIAEKDLALSEQREKLDREASERRRLQEVLTRLQENADRTLEENKQTIKGLEQAAQKAQAKVEAAQKRVDTLERLRRQDSDTYTQRLRTREGAVSRVHEAAHMSADLDISLDGMSEAFAGLRDRVKRLKQALEIPAEEEKAHSGSFVAAPEPETPAPSAAPLKLSQSSGFSDEPAPAEEAKAEPEPAAAKEAPAEEQEESRRPLEGIVKEPSNPYLQAVPPPAPGEAPGADNAEDPTDAIPLISGPDEDEPAPEEPKKKKNLAWKKK